MGLSAYGVSLAGDWESSRLTWEKILLLAVSLGAGLGVYGAACYLLRSEEVRAALELARRRTGKGGEIMILPGLPGESRSPAGRTHFSS